MFSIKDNVLVDQDGHARLADFGLLTFVSDPTNPTTASTVKHFGGTRRWMSPELLYPQKFGFEQSRPTKKSDCYALGMVVLEVLSDAAPFARYQDYVAVQMVISGERPERPERAWFTDDIWRTMEQCWLPQPTYRTTVEAVLECLERVPEIWQPLPPTADDVDTDSDESVYTTTQRMFFFILSQAPH